MLECLGADAGRLLAGQGRPGDQEYETAIQRSPSSVPPRLAERPGPAEAQVPPEITGGPGAGPAVRTSRRWPSVGNGDTGALLGLLVATLAFFWPMYRPWARMYVVAGDFSRQFFPFRAFAAQEWWAGRIPLWNPYEFAGHPFQADLQTAVFYPPAWLNAILFGRNGFPFWALEGEIVVHTFLAAAFTYLCARRLTGSRLGALIAGLAFGFGGFITSYPAQQLAVLETAVWLPLIVLLLELAVERPVSWRWLSLAGLTFGIAMLAGHPQTALFIAYATEGYLLWRLWWQRVAWRRSLGALALFPVVATGVAAVQILPTLRFLPESTRDQMDYLTAAHGYLLSALWEIFVPLWHNEKALSIGVVALLLAVLGAWASRREPLAYWTVVGLIAIPLSTGGATPLFWLLFHFAPGWNLFRDQERVIYLFSFAGALLAARGVAELQRRDWSARVGSIWVALTATAAVVAALGWAALTAGLAGRAVTGLVANLALDAGGLALTAVALALWFRRPTWRPAVGAGLALLVLAEVFAINYGNNLGPTSPDPRPRLARTAAFLQGFGEPFRVRGISEAVFPSDYGALLGLPTIGGDTPFELRRIRDMLAANADWRVWQILNVKFFISDGGPLAGLKLVFQDRGLNTYYMQDSLPRAWAVRAVEVAKTPDQARQLILAPGYHPGNVVVLEQPPAIGPITPGPRPTVQITHLDPQRITIDATASGNSMLVLADDYYPEWQAYRDGQPVPIYRANYLAMALDLPPGTHQFEIVYRPWSFYLGAGITLLTLAAIAFALGLAWRRRTVAALLARRWARWEPLAWTASALALTALAFALRAHALGVPNLTNDEWFMLRNHDEGPLWIIHQAHTFEPHPLLYYLGLAGWIEIAGRSEFAMRFLSLLPGVLLVPTLIGLGRAVLGRRAGVLVGALAAINPYQVAESQNARNYEMVTFWSALASLLFLRALRRGRPRDWLAYGAAMLLALNTHYDAALILAVHLAYLGGRLIVTRLTRRPNWVMASLDLFQGNADSRRRWLRTTAVVVAVFALWLLYAWPALVAYHGYFPTPIGIGAVLERSLTAFSLGSTGTLDQALPLLILAALGSAWLTLRRPAGALFFGLYVLLPIVAVSLLFLFRPMFDARYLIVLAPGYLMLIAVALDGLLARLWPVGLLAATGALALTGSALPATYQSMLTDRGDYRAMAAWVSTYGHPGDAIVATGYGQAELFQYYYHGPTPVQVLDQPTQLASGLSQALAGKHGLWLLPYWQSPVDVTAVDILDRLAVPVAERWFVNTRALYFGAQPDLSQSAEVGGTWANQLRLNGASLTGGTVQPGEALGSELRWHATSPLPTPKLSLRLLAGDGTIVAQSDVPLTGASTLAAGPLVTRVGLFVPLATPPGSYAVAVVLYHPDTGAALPLATAAAQRDGALILGTLAVGQRAQSFPPAEANVPLVPSVHFADGVTLLGHDPLGPPQTAGAWLGFRVLWQADRAGLPPLSRVISFVDDQGQVVARDPGPILPAFPTSRWANGEVLAEPIRVQVPPAAGSGTYTLRLSVGSGPPAVLGTLVVSGPDHAFARPAIPHPIGAQLGSFATLVGYDGSFAGAHPGSTVDLKLIWQGRGAADQSYTVFVHLVGPDGQIHGQEDQPPLAGNRPTDGWVAGEYLQDPYAIVIPPTAPTGPYHVEVGLYDPKSGVRVPVTNADGSKSDHVVLGSFTLTAAAR